MATKRCPESINPCNVIRTLNFEKKQTLLKRHLKTYPRIKKFKYFLPSAAICDVTSFYELMFVQHQREGKGANAQEKSYLPIANSFCCVHQGTFENANIKSG